MIKIIKMIALMSGLLAGMAEAATDSFLASGTWIAPAGVTSVTVEAWGGGGAGGAATGNPAKGGGGAGGQYASKVVTVVPGNSYVITVGAGGTGSSSADGTVGGDSVFAVNVVVAKGGAGGLMAATTNGTAGLGSSLGGVGTTIYAGGNGSDGLGAGTGGAGGGGAGSGGAGGNASGNTAGLGRATGGGDGGAGLTSRGTGNPGTAAGGGGAGGYATNNTNRSGGNGAAGQVTISYSPPTVTTNAASSLSATGATLNGTVSSNGTSTVVTFDIGLTAAYGSSVNAAQSPLAAGASGSTVSYVMTGLACNTLYHFRVNGTNSSGTANGGDLTFTTSACLPTVTTNAATALTSSGATLNGTVSSNGGSTTVTFDYGTTAGYGSTVTASASPLAAGATNSAVSAVLTGLTCGGTTYHYRVNGANSAGTTNGSDVVFSTPVCPPPVVVLGKTAGASAAAIGNYVTFSLTATNPTTTAMSNVVVTDDIPVGMTYSTYAATLGTASVAGQLLTWTIPSLPGGGSAQLTLVVLLTQKGTFTNTVKSTGAVDASASMLVLPSAITRYSMDEAVGTWNGTTGEVIDSGGNALNGRRRTTATPTTTNTVLPSPTIASQHASVVGDFCNAGNFDGNAVVESASSPYFQFTQRLSASAWIYPTGYPSGASDLYSILSNDVNYEFHLDPAGHLYWWWNVSTLTSAATIPLNQWTHIAITMDSSLGASSRERIYINGVADTNTNNWSGTLQVNNCPFYIGGDISTGSGCTLLPARNFHGKIDEAKIYNYELSAAEVNADMDLGRLCGAVSFDHIQIEHDGTASTCAPKVVTVKACMNSACTSLYPGTVTVKLTPTGWIPGDILTINGGVATATLNNSSISGSSLSLYTSSINPPAANITTCFNGTTATCTLSVASNSCSFNAAEVGANPQTHIYTKLAGTAFNIDVLAVGTPATSVDTTKNSTVTVDLVDTSSAACTPTSTALNTAQSVTLVSGRKTVSMTCATAAPSVQVRITSGAAQPACSTDKFAVRPSAVTLTTNANAVAPSPIAAPKIQAGQPFNIGATTTPTGYAGALTQDATKLTAQLPSNGTTQQSGGVVGTLTLSPAVTANTAQSNNATYSEVGYLYANAGTFRDTSFTSVDQVGQTAGCSTTTPESCDCLLASTATNAGVPDNLSDVLINGRYGCYVGNKTGYSFGRFIPEHFDTSINLVAGVPMSCPTGLTCPALYNGIVYSGQSFASQVIAKNLGGGTTQNYSGSFAKAITQSVWAAIGDAINQNPGPGVLNIAAPLAAADFVSGVGIRKDALSNPIPYVIYTLTATPNIPTDIYIRAQDADNASSRLTVSPATSVEGGVKVVSGRVKISNAYGSELLPLTLAATVQYYTASGWVNSITDSVTSMTLAANYNVVKNGVPTGSTTTPSPTGVAIFIGGQRVIVMGKPTGGATGTATISPVTPAYLPLTPGTATFGVYKSNNSFIYRRESY